ncbi:hypothetical protein AGR2A_Lc150162 [Agrobacterium genomosp. 2 str. CFBP 5494]|uniref:Uncharacterized protein n=1 Tax=Agrobacterium genomosp. 2 str. CFBP 5494 TaxID=1183436 RepID=A0A9W5B347_9HYPH|nr:hypothetical protein AGR2A_Lc150162 [Agrobacterium genomosp. 2 str. CFBP 5494]
MSGKQAPGCKSFLARDLVQRFVKGDGIIPDHKFGPSLQLENRSGKLHHKPSVAGSKRNPSLCECPNRWFDDEITQHVECFPERRGEAWVQPMSESYRAR